MSRWIVFAGITAMLVTGYFATFYDRGEGFLRSVKFLPQRLQQTADGVLAKEGFNWLRVEMDGQRAILSGTAPSVLDRDDAIEIVKKAAGRGGSLWGGITRVDAERLRVAAPKKPYLWSAQSGESKRVRLQGFVPSQKFKMLLHAGAKKLFPLGVEDLTVVAGGQPTGDWLGSALLGLDLLRKLENGELKFQDRKLSVFGLAATDKSKSDVEAGMQNLKRPFEGAADISLLEASNETQSDLLPEQPTVATPTQRRPPADCQALIDNAMKSNIIYFDERSADILPDARKIIDSMSQTALRCPELKLKISGHTDGSVAEASLTDLSRKRAFAAASLLKSQGIEGERLVITGVGATQPDPAAGATDLKKNRRVEFSVIP